jgi:hypothetical protein
VYEKISPELLQTRFRAFLFVGIGKDSSRFLL